MIDAFDWMSIFASGSASILTLWFWLVRARRERPDLALFLGEALDATQVSLARDGWVRNVYAVDLVVANRSSLPNAALGVRATVRLVGGEWGAARVAWAEGERPLPANVPPLETRAIPVRLELDVPGTVGGNTMLHRRERALEAISHPLAVRVEVRALGGPPFTATLEHPRPPAEAAA